MFALVRKSSSAMVRKKSMLRFSFPTPPTRVKKFSKYEQEEYICDSVIVLHYGAHELAKRYLRIIKMRRTNHVRLPIPFKITSEKSRKGILVGE